MSERERKIETLLNEHDIAGFLKALATGFKNSHLPAAIQDFPLGIHDFSRLSFDIKKQSGLYELKVKVKIGENAPSFKELKKRLKTSLKFMQENLERSTLPPAEVVGSFLQDSIDMAQHLKDGATDYASYLQICNEFKDAFDAEDKDFLTLKLKLAALNAAKKSCHAKMDK
jgi:XXXCH domain-containing protein